MASLEEGGRRSLQDEKNTLHYRGRHNNRQRRDRSFSEDRKQPASNNPYPNNNNNNNGHHPSDRQERPSHRSPRPHPPMQPPPPQQNASLRIPPPPQYPPPPHRSDRKRRRTSLSRSPSNRSNHSSSRRRRYHGHNHHRHENRGSTRRRFSRDDQDDDDREAYRNSPAHDGGGDGRRDEEEAGRRHRRSRSPRRRRSPSSPRNRRRGSSRSAASPDRRGRGRRPRRRSDRQRDHSVHTSLSSSPDNSSTRDARARDRGRTRHQRRRRRPTRRRRTSRGGHSPRPEPRHPAAVANDVPPRAGVVTDDDDGARQHNQQQQLQQQLAGKNGVPPPNQPPTTRQMKNNEATRSSGGAAAATKKQRSSHSSSHDDTIGHFKGREGTVIANRYRIEREVGVGTFGRVLECLDLKHLSRSSNSNRRDRHQDQTTVAIKIVRNVKRYYESALIEADIVEDVNRRGGRGITNCAVMYDAFTFAGHYCMVFEKLGPSLYDFQKRQKYRPFPLVCVRDFAKQLLETLEFLHQFRLIHTDLKPENILLLNDREVNYKGRSIPECTRIKVIDFGGATYDDEKKSSVVNTRQYRAPEVILGVGWSMPSDLWSIGCILAELFQGELLFATHDNVEHLALIEQVVGPFPRRMLKRAKNTQLVNEAFDSMGAHRMERALPPESLAYVKRIGSLESLTRGAETWFLRLLRRILVTDPEERATARECLRKL